MANSPMRARIDAACTKRNALAWLAAILALSLLGGCASILPPPPPAEHVYLLDTGTDAPPSPDTTRSAPKHDFTLEVSMPRTRPGFDTAKMIWVRREHGLEVYARNRWADTPAHMLAPLLVQALGRSGVFRAVVQAPSPVAAKLRLDTEIVRIQQDFSVHPSRVQITLDTWLIDIRSHQVIASAEFDESENAVSEDAYGGVRAANTALKRLLERISSFCAEHATP